MMNRTTITTVRPSRQDLAGDRGRLNQRGRTKGAQSLLALAFTLLATALPAQVPAPEIHGLLRHQLAVDAAKAQVVGNTVTAELEVDVRGTMVDVRINPFFEADPGAVPTIGLREAYLDVFWPTVDLRVGRQIVIWGKSDGLAITDIVSPKDLSSFLIPEFRELRLPVTAVKASAYFGPVELELISVPTFTPSVLPSPDSMWYTSLETPVAPTINLPPEVGGDLWDGEYYGRLRLLGGWGDLDVAGGYYWTNEPSPTVEREFSSPGVLSGITVTPEHYRQSMGGLAASTTFGPLVLRGESAFFTPRRVLTGDPTDSDGYVERNGIDSLVGVDTAFAGIDASAQLMHQVLLEYDQEIEPDEHRWTTTVRVGRSFLREQLALDAFGYIGINAPDGLVKTGATWAPGDSLSFRAEGSFFFGEEGSFGAYDENDLVVVTAKYSF